MKLPEKTFKIFLQARIAPIVITTLVSMQTAYSAEITANALPTGANITAGQASISRNAASLQINQNSQKLITNWQTFNIGTNATVNFIQPSSTAAALNRVLTANPSQILGRLNANGQVYLINPSGVVFGQGSQVNVAGLVASTHALSDENFLKGQLQFVQQEDKGTSVVNMGQLVASEGGFVVLIGAKVENSGSIEANAGQVALAAGKNARLDITESGLVGIEIDEAAPMASVDNSGMIVADGGKIWITARSASDGIANAINQTGLIRANSLSIKNGEIWLDGGQGITEIAGTIEAKGDDVGEAGGKVVATGQYVAVIGEIDASGTKGGGEVYVGGGWQGNDPEIAEATVVKMVPEARIDVSATDNGDGGTAVLWSADLTRADGTIDSSGKGLNGDGGAVETSSRGGLAVTGTVDVSTESGKGGEWLLDPFNITVVSSPTSEANLTATATNFSSDGGGSVTVLNTSIEAALNAGAGVTVTLDTDTGGADAGDIQISADISKTTGTAATLVLDAVNDITLDTGKAISSISDVLNVDFGTVTNNLGNTLIEGTVNTNGGAVNFYKLTELANTAPVSTKILGVSANTSGDITFHQNVTLTPNTFNVSLSTQGSQSGATFVGDGGDILFKGTVESGVAVGLGSTIPQSLTVDTTGKIPGSITFQGNIGGNAANITTALKSLTLTGPTSISFTADVINFAATSGDVFSASSTLGTPELILDALNTAINVSGGTINGVTGYADYEQTTFDIGVTADTSSRTLTITADRSIKIEDRTIDGSSSTGTLAVTLDSFADPAATGGAIILDTATIDTNGTDLVLGGQGNGGTYAVGFSGDIDGITDGIRIFDSNLSTNGANITMLGAAPNDGTFTGGSGVKIFGLTTIDAEGGNIVIDGRVTEKSSAGNKDGIIIGEGSNSQVTIQTSGNGTIDFTGDASLVVDANSGSRYDGVIISQGALIKTINGDITIAGTGGDGLSDTSISDQNHGIKLETLNTRIVSTIGDITLTGISGGKSNSFGIFSQGNTIYIGQESGGPVYSGLITLEADSMDFTNTSTSRLLVESTDQLRIQPLTVGRDINIGIAGSVTELALGSSLFSGSNSVFQEGFADIIIGRLAGDGTGTLTINSSTTVRDDLYLYMVGAGGNLALDAPLTVQGTGPTNKTLAIEINAGITTGAGGSITVDSLRVTGDGDFILDGTNLINTIAATSTSGKITVNNGQALTVGTVNSDSNSAHVSGSGTNALHAAVFEDMNGTTIGVTTADKAITLSTTSGDLVLADDVNATPAGNGIVSLQAAAGAIIENAADTATTGIPTVTADQLALRSSSATATSLLTNDNAVPVLATDIAGNLAFVGTTGIAINAITDGAGDTITGVTIGGSALLTAKNGDITQTEEISAGGLGLTTIGTNGQVNLATLNPVSKTNTITTLAIDTTAGADGIVDVLNDADMAIGAVTVNGITLNGITTNNEAITVRTLSGGIDVAQNINTGGSSTSTVSLASSVGGISDSGTAVITADKLAVVAALTSALDLSTGHVVDNLAATVSTANQDFTFIGAGGIIVDNFTDSALVSTVVHNGLNIADNTFLTALNGDVTQSATPADVIVGGLYINAVTGSVDLSNVTNEIGLFAADIDATGETVEVYDKDGLEIGTVTVNAIPKSGITTNNGDVWITASAASAGDLLVTQTISIGTGTAILNADDGGVDSSGTDGKIIADALRVESTEDVNLLNTANNVRLLSGKVTAGHFAYRNADTLTIDSITTTLGTGGTIAGIDTTTAADGNEQYIDVDNGDLTLNENLLAGIDSGAGSATDISGAIISLETDQGIDQSDGFQIIADQFTYSIRHR
ncbi:MAG: filamentous hemagglutinin N-terminal domain-containing protein [Pseudomonadales bacterium]|nr:filamentous hemagglutinin N-terminal domain-containing protein [Pseudomonadales bacterium]